MRAAFNACRFRVLAGTQESHSETFFPGVRDGTCLLHRRLDRFTLHDRMLARAQDHLASRCMHAERGCLRGRSGGRRHPSPDRGGRGGVFPFIANVRTPVAVWRRIRSSRAPGSGDADRIRHAMAGSIGSRRIAENVRRECWSLAAIASQAALAQPSLTPHSTR